MQNDLFALRYCFYYHCCCCCCCCCCCYCCCCCRGGGGGRRLPDFLFRLPPTKTFPLASTTTTDLSSDKKKEKPYFLFLFLSLEFSALSLSLSFSHKRESKLLQSKTPNLSEFYSFTAQTKSFSLKALRVPQLQSSNQELLYSLSWIKNPS